MSYPGKYMKEEWSVVPNAAVKSNKRGLRINGLFHYVTSGDIYRSNFYRMMGMRVWLNRLKGEREEQNCRHTCIDSLLKKFCYKGEQRDRIFTREENKDIFTSI